ncbi:MAG TPA: YdcH family protein [Burkholderiaceae bacterium]|nr:YdcH family protein [Burkholderiaceae bacterium]
MDADLHSLSRQLIELRMEHADLDGLIDRVSGMLPLDELQLQRLKKRRLALKDRIARLELASEPDEPA